MIEMIKGIGQIIDVCADLVRRNLVCRVPDHGVELHQSHLQLFLRAASRLQKRKPFQVSALLRIFVQNGFDTDNCIQNIWPRISFKRGKAVNVKHIVLGSLVGKVTVLQSGKSHRLCHLHGFFLRHFPSLPDLPVHLILRLLHQDIQSHDTAVPGLKGLAVAAVHGAVSQELQLRIRPHQLCLAGTAEYLFKVQFLTFIRNIDNLIRRVQAHTLHDGSQIRGIVQGRAVRLQDHAGRHLFGVGFLLHVHHQSAVADIGPAALLHVCHHLRDQIVHIALALPQIELHVQAVVIFLQIHLGHVHDMLPQSPVPPHSLLELTGGLQGFCLKCRILLGFGTGKGIDLREFRLGNGRFLRVISLIAFVKVQQIRLALPQLRDHHADGRAPVPKVHVADNLMAHIAADTLDALADDGGAQMSHMERLGHICAAVVYHDLPGFFQCFQSEFRLRPHGFHCCQQKTF